MGNTFTSEVIMKFNDQFSKSFQSQIKQFQKGIQIQKSTIRELEQAGRTVSSAGFAVFAPTAAVIGAATKTALDYEKSVRKVQTIANTAEKPMSQLTKEMHDVQTTYGIAFDEVGDAFYKVISGTVDTANAFKYADVAAQMSKGGFTDMTTAIDGLTSAMAVYSKRGYDMYRIGDIMAQTQVYGKLTIGDLAQTLGTVMPFAEAVGVGFEDIGASMAVLTHNGIDATMSAMGLKNMFTSILKPSRDAQKAFEELGVAYGENAFKDKDFGEYMDSIRKAVGLSQSAQQQLKELVQQNPEMTDEELNAAAANAGVNIEKLLRMFKNVRAALPAITLANSRETYTEYRKAMDVENSQGVLKKQADINMASAAEQWNRLKQQVLKMLGTLGTNFLPILNNYMKRAGDLVEKLNKLDDGQIKTIAATLMTIAKLSGAAIVLGKVMQTIAGIGKLSNTVMGVYGQLVGMLTKPVGTKAMKQTVETLLNSKGLDYVNSPVGQAEIAKAGSTATKGALPSGGFGVGLGITTALAGWVVSQQMAKEEGFKIDYGSALAEMYAEYEKEIDPKRKIGLQNDINKHIKNASKYLGEGRSLAMQNGQLVIVEDSETTDPLTGETKNEKTVTKSIHIENFNVSGIEDLEKILAQADTLGENN